MTQKKWFLSLGVLVLVAALSGGCAHDSKTYRQDTVQDQNGQTVVVRETTTTHDADPVVEDRGILGGTFHLLGEIIAFPFEIVAGAIRWIF